MDGQFTQHGKCRTQDNQLQTKSHVELEDNSFELDTS